MKRNVCFLVIAAILGLFVVGAVQSLADDSAGKEVSRQDVIYSCACGEGCNCDTVSTTPGNCRCGKPMAWGHVVKSEGDDVLVCTCAEGCACKLDADDPTKCACGNPLKRISLKDSGLYFCNCGGSCLCNTVSDKEGTCKCGMPLKKP